jgi:hypothetical protein
MFSTGTPVHFGGQPKVGETNMLTYFGPGRTLGQSIVDYSGKGTFSTDKGAEKRVSRLFDQALSSGVNPSQVALQASELSSRFPGLSTLQPGGDIWTDISREQFGLNQTNKESMADRDYMSMQILGRPMKKSERRWSRETDPSSQEFAGLLYANPKATLAAFPTEEEDKVSAYYGRMIPKKGGFTGERFSNISPVEYTGGMA